MSKRQPDEARIAILREILLQDVPHLGDDWQPPPKDDIEVESPPTVTLSAVGGRSVVVGEADFLALLDAAGVDPTPELTRTDLGRILAQAKGGHPGPLYRVRTAAGRPWRPTVATITN